MRRFPDLDLLLIESGGDNLAATFSPELVDATIYVIDVAEGEKIPRKGGPGITNSGLLVINKIDLAPYVGRKPGSHGARHHTYSRRKTSRLHQPQRRHRSGHGHRLDSSTPSSSNPERVGRDGFLGLRFVQRLGKTVLGNAASSFLCRRSLRPNLPTAQRI